MERTQQHCQIVAPISGRTLALDRVPDPVFSERMTGDGLAILLENDEVIAPCDGIISLFFDTKHAFAITTATGVQVLVHIGLDTVILNGEGIQALYEPGQEVKTGDTILRVDYGLLRKREINLISPILIVNHDFVSHLMPRRPNDMVTIGKDSVIEYDL